MKTVLTTKPTEQLQKTIAQELIIPDPEKNKVKAFFDESKTPENNSKSSKNDCPEI